MVERKKPTPRDVTYTGDRVRMTDTAQEQERVEDWTDKHLSDELLRLSRFYPSDSYWKEAALEASRRLRARQREGGYHCGCGHLPVKHLPGRGCNECLCKLEFPDPKVPPGSEYELRATPDTEEGDG